MRYNNLKIYCLLEEDQSLMFDFLFEIYRNDIKYCLRNLMVMMRTQEVGVCSLMISHGIVGQSC